MSCAVVSCGLLLALATLTAHAQLQTPLATTTGCRSPRCPSTKCQEVLNCPGGLVVDNERCPCCHVCGLQLGEECSPETTDNVTAFRYCDAASGFTCKKVSNDDGSGTAVGRCVGTRVQPCVEGRTYEKGCLKCNCTDGSLKCAKNKGITCPALTCGARERYRPVDKCCEVCAEICSCEDPVVPPVVALPGGSSIFHVTFREELRLTFAVENLARDLAQDNMLSNLGIYRNGRELLPTSKYLSIQIIRVALSQSGASFRDDFVEITFVLEAAKKTDSGNYTLAIENRIGTTSTSFILQVIKRRLKNCTFETDLCDWINGGNLNENEVGWLRRRGETPSHSTGPVAGYGGSGYYIYLETSRPAGEGQKAELRSVSIKAESHPTKLSFAYHMFGPNVRSLQVDQFRYDKDNKKVRHTLWTQSGDQGNKWHTASVTIGPIQPYVKSRIAFVATVGNDTLGDIAIDSIVLS